MSTRVCPALLRILFVGFLLVLTTRSSWAQAGQAAPHGYDFLTVMVVERIGKSSTKLYITPAFEGKTEVQLEDLSGSSFYTGKNLAATQRNTLKVNQQLSELTSAGWELAEAYPILTIYSTVTTRYLFHKAKP